MSNRRRPHPAVGSSGDTHTVLRASTPEDLLGVAPYLLGFHPEESLVVLALHGKRMGLTARVDLPADPEAPETEVDDVRYDAWLPSLRRMLAAVRQQQPTAVALLGYSPRRDLIERVLATALRETTPIGIAEAVHTDGDRWWSVICDDERCCPAAGTRYAADRSRLAAEAVYAGLSVLPTRRELAASVAGPPAGEPGLSDLLAEVTAAAVRSTTGGRVARIQTLVTRGLAPTPLAPAECLELAVLAADLTARDVAWAAMDPDDAEDHVRLWRQVVRVTPEEAALPPLCLLGAAAWICGNGALQGCCVERALSVDPDYSMANLLDDLILGAVPPSAWSDIAIPLRAELGLS